MARRLVCCPAMDEAQGVQWRYLYVDTLEFEVVDVTDKLTGICKDACGVCCLHELVGYADGSKVLDGQIAQSLPFDFERLHSFEWFKNTEELRLKTGSSEILYSCLLSYYRREYDETQQFAFFSKPERNTPYRDGVEHEMAYEERVLVQEEEEEFVPETLDKGKTDAEREAEAAAAQAAMEAELAAAEEEKEAKRQADREKRKKRARDRQAEEEYREFRNQDNVQSEKYKRYREYEEAIRAHGEQLAKEYAAGNYGSLPGYMPPEVFADLCESVDNETAGCVFGHQELYAVASRLDEFGVDYTVMSEQAADGSTRNRIYYSPEQDESARMAFAYHELESTLKMDGVVPVNAYYNAFQLEAFDYAYENYVDTSAVTSGQFSGSQMLRIFEAGLDGCNMQAVANPNYTTAQMDVLVHYMRNNWDTEHIKDPALSMTALADTIFRDEKKYIVLERDAFFNRHDFDSFVALDNVSKDSPDVRRQYDAPYREDLFKRSEEGGWKAQSGQNQSLGGVPTQAGKRPPEVEARREVHHDGARSVLEPSEVKHGGNPVTGAHPEAGRKTEAPQAVPGHRGYDSAVYFGPTHSAPNIDTGGSGMDVKSGASFGSNGKVRYGQESKNDGKRTAPHGSASQEISGNSRHASSAGSVPEKVSGRLTPTENRVVPLKQGPVVGNWTVHSGNRGTWNNSSLIGGNVVAATGENGAVHTQQQKHPYSAGGTYTPSGWVQSDGSYVKRPTFSRSAPTPGSINAPIGGASRTGRSYQGQGEPQKAPTGGKTTGSAKFSGRPLDELRVRRGFADRAGMRIQNFGSRAVQTGKQFGRQTMYSLTHNVTRSDESGTLGTTYRAISNTAFAVGLVRDLSKLRAPMPAGSSPMKMAEAAFRCKDPSQQAKMLDKIPLQTAVWEEIMEKSSQKHWSYLKKTFGDHAAGWTMSEIDQQITLCKKDLRDAREQLRPVGRSLKDALKELHPQAVMMAEKELLIEKGRELKKEIKALKKKEKLTAQEQQLLETKIRKKKANEGLIKKQQKAIDSNSFAVEIKTLTPEVMKIQKKPPTEWTLQEKIKQLRLRRLMRTDLEKDTKKAVELLKQKRANEQVLARKGRKVKDLNRLKKRKTDFEAKRKLFGKRLDAARAAEGRLKSIPGRLMNVVVQKMYESGDVTLTGIGEATGYAMSFAHNPLVRLATRHSKGIFQAKKKLPKKPKTAPTAPKVTQDIAPKAAKGAKGAKGAADAKAGANKVAAGLAKKAKAAANMEKAKAVGQAAGQKKSVRLWIKQTQQKLLARVRAAQIAKAAAQAGAAASSAGGAAAAGAGSSVLLPVIGIVVAIVLFVCILSMVSSNNTLSSLIFSDAEAADGKIDLTEYVGIINDNQAVLQDEVNSIAYSKSSVTGEDYDNVFYDYSGESNALQILTMAYVRFGFDLSDTEAVRAYIAQLYQDSNLVDAAESDLYACANGCVEREYYCYDEPDEFATNTRLTKYLASDHSDYSLVGNPYGCEYERYSCMERGHEVYHKHGCWQHNDGDAMTDPGDCDNYERKKSWVLGDDGLRKPVFYYYCQGHCSGNHRDYYCPGHKETVCYGEHQDVTITVTSLGFDDIFYADSALTAVGAYRMGEAYDKKFTVTAYCACHECCHPYDEACTGNPPKTASGTTPKANHTIAVDPDVIPLGTHVWINGKEYVAEDTGGAIDEYDIDIYFDNHQAALNWGKRKLTVYKAVIVAADVDGSDPYGFDGWTEENIELVKHIYEGVSGNDADKIYHGLDGLTSFAYGSYSGSYDFSGVDFGTVDTNGLTNYQRAILSVIEANKAETQRGYCQAWVADIYLYAGTGARVSKCCANHAGEAWGVSDDWSKIQVGATVYGYSSSIYGHVGIYIGNGMVAHNIGYVKIQSLESWVKTYNGVCWGWNGGYNLSGKSAYSCKPAGTFMTGKD